MKICIETNENENTTTQNLWNSVKAVLRGRFIAIQACLKKQEKSQINNLTVSGSHTWMWELDYKESWALKIWSFWTAVLDKTVESPWDCKKIQPVHPKGDQSWVFIGRTDVQAETPILWPSDVNSWLTWKGPDAGKDWRWEEKGTTEDEMVGWLHWLNGHESE